jgi:hypothetical protein
MKLAFLNATGNRVETKRVTVPQAVPAKAGRFQVSVSIRRFGLQRFSGPAAAKIGRRRQIAKTGPPKSRAAGSYASFEHNPEIGASALRLEPCGGALWNRLNFNLGAAVKSKWSVGSASQFASIVVLVRSRDRA